MSFERALQENPPPAGQVGDIHLRYEPPVLIGETARPPERALRWGQWLLGGGALFGLVCLAVLMTDGPVPVAMALAAVSCALCAAGLRLDGRAKARRRFLLHFGNETLRVDSPSASARVLTRTVPFDDVTDLYVLVDPDGTASLLVEARFKAEAPPSASLLVDGVPRAQHESLQRLWATLRSAFGLRPAPKEG